MAVLLNVTILLLKATCTRLGQVFTFSMRQCFIILFYVMKAIGYEIGFIHDFMDSVSDRQETWCKSHTSYQVTFQIQACEKSSSDISSNSSNFLKSVDRRKVYTT